MPTITGVLTGQHARARSPKWTPLFSSIRHRQRVKAQGKRRSSRQVSTSCPLMVDMVNGPVQLVMLSVLIIHAAASAPLACHGDLLHRLANASRNERITWWYDVKCHLRGKFSLGRG